MQMNISQLAELFDLDRATVRKRLRSASVEPVASEKGINRYSSAEAAAAILTPKGIPTTDPDHMTPQDRKAWFESEARRRDLEERDRQLLRREEVSRVLSTTVATFAESMRALPDRLEREAGIEGRVAAEVERIVDAHLDQLRRTLLSVVHD